MQSDEEEDNIETISCKVKDEFFSFDEIDTEVINSVKSPVRKSVNNERLRKIIEPNKQEAKFLSNKAAKRFEKINKKMEKVQIAPGEFGEFKNWGEDIYLEEKCFPHIFPYGAGGYLSTNLDAKDTHNGFASYVRHRIMSADPKYRQDYIYLFFLLLVKELVQLKRCKSTYLRQARKLPNLTKTEVLEIGKTDLPRYNRSFEVYKTMRGTSMYYQDAKKNLMAALRQNGCPNLFLTVSCAEYQWKELVRQILETEFKQEVSMAYVESLSESECNKIISRSAVQSTVHFQKRVEKIFELLKYDDIFEGFTVQDFYYRIEFQARGAPHLHALLWLVDADGKSVPTFWSSEELKESKLPKDLKDDLLKAKPTKQVDQKKFHEDQEARKLEISQIAKMLIFGSVDDAKCNYHRVGKCMNHREGKCDDHIDDGKKDRKGNDEEKSVDAMADHTITDTNTEIVNKCCETFQNSDPNQCENCQIVKEGFNECDKCKIIKERVQRYNQHNCTFTCHKKKKALL